jgi:homoserine dehydrogenase
MLPQRTQITVALLGFGNVGRAFARYIQSAAATNYPPIGIRAIADSTGGLLLDDDSLIERAMIRKEAGLCLREFAPDEVIGDSGEFTRALRSAGISLLVESLPTNIADGQPGLGLVTAALEQGTHVVTVDKGPLVHGLEIMKEAAMRGGARFGYSGTTGVSIPGELAS